MVDKPHAQRVGWVKENRGLALFNLSSKCQFRFKKKFWLYSVSKQKHQRFTKVLTSGKSIFNFSTPHFLSSGNNGREMD